jgi:hypothetical protein
MNMKNTVILLIFLLSILGLIMGVYCTQSADSDSSQNQDSDVVVLDDDSITTVSLTDNENNVLDGFFS